jgi:hypothetical protein
VCALGAALDVQAAHYNTELLHGQLGVLVELEELVRDMQLLGLSEKGLAAAGALRDGNGDVVQANHHMNWWKRRSEARNAEEQKNKNLNEVGGTERVEWLLLSAGRPEGLAVELREELDQVRVESREHNGLELLPGQLHSGMVSCKKKKSTVSIELGPQHQ